MPTLQQIMPRRMCVVCRERFDQDNLARLSLEEGEYRIWQKGAKGRSIYICSIECFQQAIKRRFFDRQKASVSKEVIEYFEETQ